MRAIALAAVVALAGCGEEYETLPEARVEMLDGYPTCVGATWQEQYDGEHLLCRWECASWNGVPYTEVEALVTRDGIATFWRGTLGVCR